MYELLGHFYASENLAEAVKQFLIMNLREEAADMAMRGEDTKGIKEANAAVERSFAKLKELYGKQEQPVTENEAR